MIQILILPQAPALDQEKLDFLAPFCSKYPSGTPGILFLGKGQGETKHYKKKHNVEGDRYLFWIILHWPCVENRWDKSFFVHYKVKICLVVSTPLKNISQIGSFPQIGVKIKNIGNHHPEKIALKLGPEKSVSQMSSDPSNHQVWDIFWISSDIQWHGLHQMPF